MKTRNLSHDEALAVILDTLHLLPTPIDELKWPDIVGCLVDIGGDTISNRAKVGRQTIRVDHVRDMLHAYPDLFRALRISITQQLPPAQRQRAYNHILKKIQSVE